MGALSRPKFFDKHPRPFTVYGDYDASASKPVDPTRLQLHEHVALAPVS
jgi:hypothetical protein